VAAGPAMKLARSSTLRPEKDVIAVSHLIVSLTLPLLFAGH
jgi:hypothetical protein